MQRLEKVTWDKSSEKFILEYKDLEVEIITKVYPATRYEPEDYRSITMDVDWDYEVDKQDLYEFVQDYLPEEANDLNDWDEIVEYIDNNFEKVMAGAKDEIEDFFLDKAIDEATEYYQERYDDSGPDYEDYEDDEDYR